MTQMQVQKKQSAFQPSYNAVKIEINNPQVNAPSPAMRQMASPAPITAPIYNVPTASVYEVPTKSEYTPKQNSTPPLAKKPVPVAPTPAPVPAPIIALPTEVAPATVNSSVVTAKKPEPVVLTPAKTVDVKTPELAKPKLDVSAFVAKLSSPDYEQQAKAMEKIADLAQKTPQDATELLDVKIIDSLLNIMSTDSSKLEGPTAKQLQAREKIINGKTVTDAEKADAKVITPMEQAERNKQYAIYTTAILEKLYGSEIEKASNVVVPLTELPGAAGIVEQIKTNPNPMVRASGIDALSYIQRPEYKADLTTLLTVAKNDKDVNVQKAATTALAKLEKLTDVKEVPSTEKKQ